VIPRAHYVYVDSDLVAGKPRAGAARHQGRRGRREADLTDPAAVLANPDVLAVIDPARPVCVLLACVLYFLCADAARKVVTGYAQLLAPGSVIAISLIRNDDPVLWERVRDAYTAGTLRNHSLADIASFLDGLEIVPPGVVLARRDARRAPDPGRSRLRPRRRRHRQAARVLTTVSVSYLNLDRGGLRIRPTPGAMDAHGYGYDFSGLVLVMADGTPWPDVLVVGEAERWGYQGQEGAQLAARAIRQAGGPGYEPLFCALPRGWGDHFASVIFVNPATIEVRLWHSHHAPDWAERDANLAHRFCARPPGR